jgi:hypothetical protein
VIIIQIEDGGAVEKARQAFKACPCLQLAAKTESRMGTRSLYTCPVMGEQRNKEAR